MRKVLSFVLILAMLLTMASFPAIAAEQVVSGSIPWNDNYMQANGWKYGPWLDNDETTGDGTYQLWSDEIATAPFYNEKGELLGNYFELDLGAEYDVESVVIRWGSPTFAWGFVAPIDYSISFAGEDKVYGEATSYTDIHQKYRDGALPENFVTSTNTEGYKDAAQFKADVTETNVGTARYVRIQVDKYQWKLYIRDIVVTVDDGTSEQPDLSEAITSLGAGIRPEGDGLDAGIRFGAVVDKAKAGIEGTYNYNTNDVKLGMWLLPARMLEEGETLEDYVKAGKTEAVDVQAMKILLAGETTITYTAVLTGIPSNGYDVDIVALPYATKGEETVFFEEMKQSFAGAALAALKSFYEEGNPNELTEENITDCFEIIETAGWEYNPIHKIKGITVTGEGITSANPDTRPYSIICNGVSGEGQAIAWGDELFVSGEQYGNKTGDPNVFSLTFDLGKKYDVSRFFFGIGWDSAEIVDAELLGSNDGATWTSVKSGLATAWSEGYAGGNMIGVDLTDASYRFFKLDVKQTAEKVKGDPGSETYHYAMQIHEVEFTGVLTEDAGEEPAPSIVYYNIDDAAAKKGLNYSDAVLPASLFVLPAGYNAYEINGTYKVDADTLCMLTTVPCIGEGTIKYKDYVNFTSYITTISSEWGQYNDQGYGGDNYGKQIVSAPVSKLSDPVYMSMVLPSEGLTYMGSDRTVGNNMHAPSADTVFNRLNALGAVYMNTSLKSELKANYSGEQVNLNFANIKLLIRTKDKWIERVVEVPKTNFGEMYILPWTLEGSFGASHNASIAKLQNMGDYAKVTLNIDDFLYTTTVGSYGKRETIDERVFHFWGGVYTLEELGISEDTDVIGVIASYELWIDEAELAPYFISSIGADWRLTNGNTRQAFAGYKHAVSTEKQVVFGHSFGSADYDEYVAPDLEYVKDFLGIE